MKSYYPTFDEYVKDFPDAEIYREMATNENLIKTTLKKNKKYKFPRTKFMYWILKSYFTCMPGDFCLVHIVTWIHLKEWKVSVDDGDDMYMEKYFTSEDEAIKAANELINLAPFHFNELKAFGYENG